MKKLFILLALLPALALAQDVTFQADVDKRTVGMGDTLTLRLTIAGANLNVSRPELPPVPGFQVYSAGQSHNFSFVNGRSESRVTFTYALAPQAPGDYTIPALALEAGGRRLSTEPIPVKVVAGAAPPAAAPSAGPPETERVPAGRRDMYITTSVDKKSSVVGEPVTLTFRFYSRARLTSQPSYSPPDTRGFLAEDLPPQRSYAAQAEGVDYSVVELKTALFPTAPGKAVIGPAALECRVQDFNLSGDPFASFFEDFFSAGKPVVLRSEPITVQVAPLPDEGRPASFRGDVGDYRLSAALDKDSADAHEPVTLTVTVAGDGNVKAVAGPALPPLEGFKVYDTLASVNVSKEGYRVQGSKVFKTVLKPDVTGELRVPPIAFSFYSPKDKSYKTLRTEPLRLRVRPSAAPETPVPAAAAPAEGLKVVSRDIRYIKPAVRLRPRRAPAHLSGGFLWLNVLPGLLFALLWTVLWGRRRLLADREGLLFRRAYARARAGLRRARKDFTPATAAAFHAALQRVLADYLGRKLRAPAQGLAWPQIEEALRRKGAPAEVARELADVWEEFHRLRFAPGAAQGPDDLAARLERLLPRLERAL